MKSNSITLPPTRRVAAEAGTSRRRLLAAVAFAAFTLGVSVMLARRLTHTSWPLPLVFVVLVGVGACAILVAGRHPAKMPLIARQARLSRLAQGFSDRPA